jgi:probable HAF family extracellular repeat protein
MIGAVCVVTLASPGVFLLRRGPDLYTMTVLPSLGSSFVDPEALNDRGQIVGTVDTSQGSHLFIWDRADGMQDLGPASMGQLDINNAGQIAGTTTDPSGNQQAFLWEPGKGRTMLGTLGGRMSVSLGINNRGQVVGVSDKGGDRPGLFLWDETTGMKELHKPPRCGCWPRLVNDLGQVLAESLDSATASPHAFLLGPDGPVELEAVQQGACLMDMNNNSWIVGVRGRKTKNAQLALWQGQQFSRQLCRVGPLIESARLNDRNQVTYTETNDSRWMRWRDRWFRRRSTMSDEMTSYLWDPRRGRLPLNRYIRGARRFIVRDLNNNGSIVAAAQIDDDCWQAILLEPIPERWGR